MATFYFESEDLNLHELLAKLEQEKIPEGMSATVALSEKAKDGQRPVSVEILSIVTTAFVAEKVLGGVISFVVKEALTKLKEIAFADPHVLIRFDNGAKRKILYDKGASEIAEELVALVSKGDVISIEFKS